MIKDKTLILEEAQIIQMLGQVIESYKVVVGGLPEVIEIQIPPNIAGIPVKPITRDTWSDPKVIIK